MVWVTNRGQLGWKLGVQQVSQYVDCVYTDVAVSDYVLYRQLKDCPFPRDMESGVVERRCRVF